MRRIALSAIVAAALLHVAAPAGAKAAPGRTSFRCSPARRHVIAADAQAMVYTVRKSEESVEYRGCVYGSTRSYDVGGTHECFGPGGCSGTGRLALAGMMLAEEYSHIVEGGRAEWIVEVENLRTNRLLDRMPTGVSANPELIGTGFAAAIVVKADGAVAWITEYPAHGGTEYEVHALDSTSQRLLATGTNIDPSSLALAGSTLYWTQAGSAADGPGRSPCCWPRCRLGRSAGRSCTRRVVGRCAGRGRRHAGSRPGSRGLCGGCPRGFAGR